jgi:hypothetical protein
MTVDPFDIEHVDPAQVSNRHMPVQPQQAPAAVAQKSSLMARVHSSVKNSVSMVAVEHFAFQNTSTYARIYLHYGDHADYLRTGFSPAWEKRFDAFEILLAEIADKSKTANVPFVLTATPSLTEASLSREKSLPAGVDPYAFNARLKQISLRHGVQFIDTLDAFKRGPGANELFYVSEGHMNGEGQGLVSRTLVEQLTKDQSALLSGRNETRVQTAGEQGK